MPVHIDSPTPAHAQAYKCPPARTPTGDSNDSNVHGWVTEAIQEGQRYLESQKGYDDIDLAINLIVGEDEKISKALSHVKINMVKRDISEIVATLSNIRMLGEIKVDNKSLDRTAAILNRLNRAWYLNTFADREIRAALQFAAVGASGYCSMGWKRDFWSAGRGDIVLSHHGPRNVLPIQIGPDHDLQDAYAVTIKVEMGLMRAISRWPDHADIFQPQGERPGWFRRALRKLKFQSPALNASEADKHKEDDAGFPSVDIFYTYILDLSINDSSHPVEMGDPGTKWSYTVPYVGQDIQTGARDSGGQMLYRKADWEDCLLYPLRRRIISTPLGNIDDNSSPWWHRKVPVVQFKLDDWPWDFLGLSLTRDVAPAQQSFTRIARAMDDSVNARLDAPIGYDDTSVSKALAERFSPRKPAQRVRMNMQMGDAMKMLVPPEYYNLPAYMPEFLKLLGDSIPSLLGTRGLQAMSQMKQLPAGDTLEKLMELAGPRTADKSRNMERSIRDLTDMWKGMAFEFYDTKRVVTMLGPDGVTETMFDYDPENMVPSHTPSEFALIKDGKMDPNEKSRVQLVDRARSHIDSFYAHVKPYSAHQMTQMTNRLQLFQLFIRGFPIDPETIAEAFDMSGFGRISDYAHIFGIQGKFDTILDRYFAWEGIKAAIAQAAGGGQPQQRGRKPSGQTAPTMQGKSGGRQTIRESPR